MDRKKVLVVGGTGHFGRLLVDDLRRHTNCELIVAGRGTADLLNPASLETALSGVAIAICAAGPFQKLPTTLLELCVRKNIHYIDLADDRAFVAKIHSLVSRQRGNLPAICTAWSTVSALSGLLVQIGAKGSDQIDSIYIHMAPGNRLPRGTGTFESLLHSLGQPIKIYRDGQWQMVRGWSQSRSFRFPPPIGARCGYLVDVPDHEFFPSLFQARTVEFRTAAEFSVLNWAVSFLGWCVRAGLIRDWSGWSKTLQRVSAVFGFIGHDWGGVGVEVGASKGHRRVSVVTQSEGQRIAVMPASIMVSELLSGAEHRGVVSPATWITEERLVEECRKRGFQLIVEAC